MLRNLYIAVLLLICAVPVAAQTDRFPATAKVISSGLTTVPDTGGIARVDTPPAVRNQFPNAPATTTRRIPPESYIATTVELEGRIYVLRGGSLIEPGTYPASIDGRAVRLLGKDKKGKPKTYKFYVLSVSSQQ